MPKANYDALLNAAKALAKLSSPPSPSPAPLFRN